MSWLKALLLLFGLAVAGCDHIYTVSGSEWDWHPRQFQVLGTRWERTIYGVDVWDGEKISFQGRCDSLLDCRGRVLWSSSQEAIRDTLGYAARIAAAERGCR